ncbi:Hypothetical predicted protein, partial [Olea europaea subsp. europaea]
LATNVVPPRAAGNLPSAYASSFDYTNIASKATRLLLLTQFQVEQRPISGPSSTSKATIVVVGSQGKGKSGNAICVNDD